MKERIYLGLRIGGGLISSYFIYLYPITQRGDTVSTKTTFKWVTLTDYFKEVVAYFYGEELLSDLILKRVFEGLKKYYY